MSKEKLESKEVIGTVVVQTAEEKLEAFRKMKNDASKRMLARKKAALEKLIALAKRSGNDEERAAAAYLSGEQRVKTSGNGVLDLIVKKGTVHEVELFKDYKMGRTEMRRFMKAHPEVKFNTDDCVYTITK